VTRSEDVGDRSHLDTITGLGTSTVHFDVADLVSIDTGVGKNLLVEELLGTSVGMGDRYGLSRVVGSSAKDASEDVVLVGKCILVSLEDDGTNTITTAVTIGSVVVGLAGTSLGQELTLGKTGENVRVGKDVQTTGTSSVTVTGPQRSAGKLDSGKRRRASSVDRVRRTAELEVVVDATGSESTYTTSDEVGVDVLGSVDLTPIIRGLTVEGTDAVELGRGSTVRDVTRLLEGLVGGDKSQTTHGISLSSLTGRHVEEARVEKTRLVDEATEGSVGLVLALSGRIAVSVGVETVGGDLAVNIKTLLEKFPESLSAGSAGETSRHTDNGNLVVLGTAISGISDGRLPSRVVNERDRRLATSLDGGDEAVGNIADTNAEDLGGSVGAGSDLGNTLLKEAVPTNGGSEHVVEGQLEELVGVLGDVAHASRARVDQRAGLVSLEELGRVLSDDGLDVSTAVEVLGVVRSEDGNLDAVVLANSLRLFEEALGGGRRTADGDGHGANSADVSVAGGGNASSLVESTQGILGGLLVDASDDGRPALLGHEVLTQCGSGVVDADTSAEGDTDSLNTKSDELIKRSGGSDGSSSEGSSAESKDASVGSRRKLASVLGEVTDVVTKLGDGDQGALEVRKLQTLLVVEVEQVVEGHEIWNGIALRARELGNLCAHGNDGTLQEVEDKSILGSQDHLTEQRVLLGGLIAEKKNVRHFDEKDLVSSVIVGELG
jgi:hypothetical protein